MISKICIALNELIFSFLDLVSKLRYKSTCSIFNKYCITDLYNIERHLVTKLNQTILEQYSYKNVKCLKLQNNKNHFDLTRLSKLKKLYIFHCKYIEKLDVKCLNLEKLAVSHGITNLNYMTNLRELSIGSCDLDDSDIKDLNLEKLCISGICNIKNINHMSNLKVLRAEGPCNKLGDFGIKNLNLEQLFAQYNEKITNVNHMSKLKVLCAAGRCGIGDFGIKDVHLEVLYASYNKKITNVNHMSKLKILYAEEDPDYYCSDQTSGIGNFGIKDIKLEELVANFNTKITNVDHMHNLKILHAQGNCGIDDEGIEKLVNLEALDASFNKKIKNVNHLSKLKILDIHAHPDTDKICGIDDFGISEVNLIMLNSNNNHKITNVNHMSKLKILHASDNLKMLYAEFNEKIRDPKLRGNTQLLDVGVNGVYSMRDDLNFVSELLSHD